MKRSDIIINFLRKTIDNRCEYGETVADYIDSHLIEVSYYYITINTNINRIYISYEDLDYSHTDGGVYKSYKISKILREYNIKNILQ